MQRLIWSSTNLGPFAFVMLWEIMCTSSLIIYNCKVIKNAVSICRPLHNHFIKPVVPARRVKIINWERCQRVNSWREHMRTHTDILGIFRRVFNVKWAWEVFIFQTTLLRVSCKIEWKKCEVLEEIVNGVFVVCWLSASVVLEKVVALIIQ